jgi:hypothetical protein
MLTSGESLFKSSPTVRGDVGQRADFVGRPLSCDPTVHPPEALLGYSEPRRRLEHWWRRLASSSSQLTFEEEKLAQAAAIGAVSRGS